jgi:hypothetical protein
MPADLDDGEFDFDIKNDPLPDSGCIGMRGNGIRSTSKSYDGYFHAFYFKRIRSLPRGWSEVAPGKKYELMKITCEDTRIIGEKDYFTVTSSGTIVACDETISSRLANKFGQHQILRRSIAQRGIMKETEAWASSSLQFFSDRRFCWLISAEEGVARVCLGAEREEIKSLLYARSLPLSATGRRRPVLHLVEAHKRRLRNGIDIDVTAFLRGIQTVNIEGTTFTVTPPAVMASQLSKPSQSYYEVAGHLA